MQESLFNTVQKLQTEQKVNVEELETLLGSNIEEVVSLCKKACLKPKTDSMGNAYFTKDDFDILKKMKELYSQTQAVQKKTSGETSFVQKSAIEEAPKNGDLVSPNKKINLLAKAKNRIKAMTPVTNTETTATATGAFAIQGSLQRLENNLIGKFSELLSEKMDGFDEIIVELIRSKTENENLRQQVNDLNKQVFVMKKELAAYVPLPLGLYAKKESNDL